MDADEGVLFCFAAPQRNRQINRMLQTSSFSLTPVPDGERAEKGIMVPLEGRVLPEDTNETREALRLEGFDPFLSCLT